MYLLSLTVWIKGKYINQKDQQIKADHAEMFNLTIP